jgi:DNA anti-recombination protein RmuC
MTLNEVLEKAGRRFDEIAASHLVSVEEMLRHHGATSEELDIELARLRAQHAEDRQHLLAAITAVFYSWDASAPIWKAPASAWLH